MNKKHDNRILTLWSKIIASISGYLIKKSYSKLKNRTSDFLLAEDEKPKSQEKNIDQKDYIILRKLGQGSNNLVQLIYHIEKGQLFALKKPQVQSSYMPIQDREIKNYKQISHPFLPKYICNANDQGVNCIVTEFIDGLSLLELSHLENNEKIKIIFNILIVIEYLHNKNFIYRDLKMNNVIIDQNKTAVLIDFDRMRNQEDITTNVTNDFAHAFIAPEATNGQLSCACDIYSIGILIYSILTMELQKDYNSNFDNDYVEFNNIPSEFSEFKEICKKCTNQEPLKRPKISELINEFYIKFYSKIHTSSLFSEFTTNLEYFSEKNTVMSIKDIHTEKFNKYWISLSEYNNPIAQCHLGFLYFSNEMIPKNSQKAFYYILLSARSNYVRAFHLLGFIYYTGEIVKKDIEKSIFYFTKAADMNYMKSQFSLAQIYDVGRDVPRNINKSIHYYSLVAEQNDVESQFILGEIYNQDSELPRSIDKAIYYYSLADKQNHPEAQLNLGKIYYIDKKELDKAFYYFTKAAKQGIAESHHYLGVMYYNGEHVEKNIDKAISHFLIASNEQIDESALNLGEIYYENKKDIDKAIHYYTISANRGNAIAQDKLGFIFASNKYGRIDTNKAIKYFTYAANKGIITSQMNLGNYYLYGINIIADIDKAINYFLLAANQDNKKYSPIAQLNLGIIYKNFKNQINKSIYFLTQSANNGNLEALCQLGIIYCDDKYNIKDINKAVSYFESAAKSNYSDAQYRLGLIYYCDKYKKNINRALSYFADAAKQKHSQALLMLGTIYHNSKYVPVDIEKAIYYYNEAAELNNIKALNNLGVIYNDDKLGKKDIEKALYYFGLAAEKNDKLALTNIGLIYMNNKNISRNVQKAVSYLTKAAELHDYLAQYYLGTIYLNEKFEMQDINKSIYYFTSSARHNFHLAQLNLGVIYLNNTYVKRNIVKSLSYFYSAFMNGNVNAMCDLGYIYHEGKYIQQDIQRAIYLYKQASSFNSKYAKNNLGVIFATGLKIEKNISEAIYYFNDAINHGDSMLAPYNLAIMHIFEDIQNNDLELAIKLLIKSRNSYFYHCEDLLCLALVKKLKTVNFENLNEVLNFHNNKIKNLGFQLSSRIKELNLENKYYFDLQMILLRNSYFVYIHNKIIMSNEIEDISKNKELPKNNKISNITSDFYEGLGYIK